MESFVADLTVVPVCLVRASTYVRDRIDALAQVSQATDEREIRAFMRDRHISWYVLRPESQVAWPDSVLNAAVFRCGGYSVFRFAS